MAKFTQSEMLDKSLELLNALDYCHRLHCELLNNASQDSQITAFWFSVERGLIQAMSSSVDISVSCGATFDQLLTTK